MNRVGEAARQYFERCNRFLRRHRIPVVGVSTLLITSLVIQQAFFTNVPEAKASLTSLRQEINIINGSLSAASGAYATSSAIVAVDTDRYDGDTYYFEVVASTTAATNATVSLVNAATGAVIRTITINGTAYDRYRSTSFTAGNASYKVRLGNEAVGKGIIAARVVVLQSASPITLTSTQIEIGNNETYSSGTMSPLAAPKYWKYDSSKWDGDAAFYAEVTYGRVTDTTTASSTTYTTSGSRSFTVPSNITGNVSVQLWGGGGGGGAGSTNTTGSGSGGAGGQYAIKSIAGLAGLTKTVVVATAGPGGSGTSAGTVGGNSTWDSTVVVANGGNGGAANSGAAGTGNTTGAVGDTVYAGGNGAAGTSGGVSGGGGEGARSNGTGGNATTGTGGSGGDGGDGANGISTNGTPSAGSAPGGAGAGGRSTGNPNEPGSDGAIGRAIISYTLTNSATTTIVLQESDGTGDGFTGWSDKITIVNAGSALVPTNVRSTSFAPTNGRNYRIAMREGYNGAVHAVYNAKIIVDQTNSNPTKLETQYLLANKTLFSGTALQKFHTYWDSAEWGTSGTTYRHQVDAANGSASVVEIDTEAGVQVVGSQVSSPDNSGISGTMTMPATGDLDVKATTNNGDVHASRILVTVEADTTAPTPNPPRFTTVPTPDSTSQVSMTSVTLTDVLAVEYFFTATSSTCGNNLGTGGTNSGWQSGASYSDSGLQTNRCYAYTIKGRDAAGNMTSTSTASTTYTLAAVPGGPTYGSVGVTSFTISNTENGNPASNPTTNFVFIASSTDARWNNKYLTAAAGTSTTPVWLTDAQVNNLSITNLLPNTRYDFSAVARNQNLVLTATSTRTGTTTLPDTAAPSPNPATFSTEPTNNGTTQIDMSTNAGTDVSTPISYYFDAVTGACGVNLGTGGTDSGWQTTTSFSDTGLDVNKCYSYTVQSRDSLSNTGTVSGTFAEYTEANVPSAPTLGGATDTTFTITNNENGNPGSNPTTQFAAQIVATSPSDDTWQNKYINTDGTPSNTPIWMSDATMTGLTVTGLDFSTQYTVQVMARNGFQEQTASSSSSNITTTADSTAPTPNPATFSSAPNNDSVSQISMTATAATDTSTPISYYFTAVVGTCGAAWGTGYTDSGWQSADTTYSDDGLQTNKCYGYTITTRDSIPNTGTASAASVAYTSAAVPGAVTLVSKSDEAITINNTENGNPASNPATQFAIFITSADATWNNKYVDASGNPSASAVWRTDAQFDGITVLGLTATTEYTFAVKARNADNDETAFGANQSITTLDPIFPKTLLQGVRLNGVRVY